MSKPNGVVLALICLSANLLTLKAADPPTIKIFDVIVNLGTAEANSNCKERKTFFINTRFEVLLFKFKIFTYIYFCVNHQVSFLQAYLICDRYGYELATLESPNEQTNLFKYLETRYSKYFPG